jgi:hypothetical protein
MIRVHEVQPLSDFCVRLSFTDESRKDIDLKPFLDGPVFEAIRNNLDVFRTVRVDHRAGTIVWPNGADIDPDVLYFGLQPAWMENNNAPQANIADVSESEDSRYSLNSGSRRRA